MSVGDGDRTLVSHTLQASNDVTEALELEDDLLWCSRQDFEAFLGMTPDVAGLLKLQCLTTC